MKKSEKAKKNGMQAMQKNPPQAQPQQRSVQVSPNDIAMAINKNATLLADKLMESFSIIQELKALNEKQEKEIERLNEKLKKKK